MRYANDLTCEYLREILRYEPGTGIFYWRAKTAQRIRVGDVAGSYQRGYRILSIDNHDYPAHRVAWMYVHGYWPPVYIDHINGVPSDNRIVNLRLATATENMRNRKTHANNVSGLRGVALDKRNGKWRARISIYNKRFFLGSFVTSEEASAAYADAAVLAFGEFYRAA